MKRTVAGLAIAATSLAACQGVEPTRPSMSARAEAPLLTVSPEEGQPVAGRYIVVFNDDVSDPRGKALAKVAAHGGALHYAYTAAVKGFAADLDAGAVAALRVDPDVSYVEQDQVMHAVTTETGATWGLDRIDQRSLPLSTTYTFSGTGSNVTAYIIDTGIRLTHSEFGGRAVKGIDEVTAGGTALDCNGHGTHVSGTVGGATYGVAKSVTLVAVRVLDCNGSGYTSGVIAGVDWVTQNHVTSSVANMSLGGGASTTLDNAVTNSINSGVTYAIAAGNGNVAGRAQDACKSSPARVPAAITVGATDRTDTKASWSNYGKCLDIFAPGVSITSAWNTSNTATNTISGTSMATPHVAGVAALYVGSHPGDTPQQVRDALVANGTSGVVRSAGSRSPNVLLYTNY